MEALYKIFSKKWFLVDEAIYSTHTKQWSEWWKEAENLLDRITISYHLFSDYVGFLTNYPTTQV